MLLRARRPDRRHRLKRGVQLGLRLAFRCYRAVHALHEGGVFERGAVCRAPRGPGLPLHDFHGVAGKTRAKGRGLARGHGGGRRVGMREKRLVQGCAPPWFSECRHAGDGAGRGFCQRRAAAGLRAGMRRGGCASGPPGADGRVGRGPAGPRRACGGVRGRPGWGGAGAFGFAWVAGAGRVAHCAPQPELRGVREPLQAHGVALFPAGCRRLRTRRGARLCDGQPLREGGARIGRVFVWPGAVGGRAGAAGAARYGEGEKRPHRPLRREEPRGGGKGRRCGKGCSRGGRERCCGKGRGGGGRRVRHIRAASGCRHPEGTRALRELPFLGRFFRGAGRLACRGRRHRRGSLPQAHGRDCRRGRLLSIQAAFHPRRRTRASRCRAALCAGYGHCLRAHGAFGRHGAGRPRGMPARRARGHDARPQHGHRRLFWGEAGGTRLVGHAHVGRGSRGVAHFACRRRPCRGHRRAAGGLPAWEGGLPRVFRRVGLSQHRRPRTRGGGGVSRRRARGASLSRRPRHQPWH